MQLNDPFGRVSRNNQRAYTALRQRLRQEGVGDAAAVARVRKNIARTALRIAAIGLGVLLCLIWAFPQSRGPLAALGVLALAWFAVNYLLTSTYLRRYLREECEQADEGRSAQ
ncbi:MAG TPA: hypothetical protein PLY75_13245 [Gammaproteobacteria bacterium]|nr:hypothetical protein [Gammaproteobacteria bacterium]